MAGQGLNMWAGVRILEAPAADALPISVEKMAHRLRIDEPDTAEAELITDLIHSACAMIDGPDGRGYALMRQTWVKVFPGFGCDLILPGAPIVGVSSVQYRDASDAWVTLDAASYVVDVSVEPAVITLAKGAAWPAVSGPSPVRVNYLLGKTDAEDLDKAAVSAVALLVGHLHGNKEAVVIGTIAGELPLGAETMLRRISRVPVAA